MVDILINWLCMKFSFSQNALLYAKCQKKPKFSPKGVIKNFYYWCHLITPIVVWAGPMTIGLVHFFILPNTSEAHCESSSPLFNAFLRGNSKLKCIFTLLSSCISLVQMKWHKCFDDTFWSVSNFFSFFFLIFLKFFSYFLGKRTISCTFADNSRPWR